MAFFKKLIGEFRRDMISSYVGEICSIHKHNSSFIGKLTNVDIDEDGNVRCFMEQYFHSWHDDTSLYFIDHGLTDFHYIKSIYNVKRLNNTEREYLGDMKDKII